MTKYAVIQTGSKQYRVEEGDVIDVELLEGDDKKVEFDVLFFTDGKKAKVGEPLVKGAKAQGEVLDAVRGPKVISYKYKKRKSSHRKVGHRQDYARVKITKLSGSSTGGAKSGT
ncbi:MAG: 50S ribosomal protein L21 [Chlamydiales bacterium]|nr:50S ribosomal protein L21 [Chlamydiales bacterium]